MRGALGVSGLLLLNSPIALSRTGAVDPKAVREIYARNTIIDCLASPASFNVPWPPFGPLTPTQLENVTKSGLTAVNVTVSSTDFNRTVSNIAFWQNEIRKHPSQFLLVTKQDEIKQAKAGNKLGLILGFQHTEMMGRDLSLLETFYNLGVRIVQLTYNKRNFLGDGCLEPGNGGLSKLGRQAVERMNDMGMAVDLSHCNTQTTADGIEHSRKPVIISHSGCREVYRHPRSKEDQELRAMAERGGVIGIYLMPFLGNDGTPYPSQEMLLSHIEHALDVCGSDHVGIGSDLSITPVEETPEYLDTLKKGNEHRKKLGIQAPGEADRFPYLPDLNHPRRLETVALALGKRGHSEAIIEKIIGANFYRVFGEIWN